MDEVALVAELLRAHGVHTILLYGSRARGDATAESDIDVATFADVDVTLRDARRWNGMFLDAFVYPTAVASELPDVEMLKLRGAKVLLDVRGLAAPLLARVAARDRLGPTPITEDDRQMRIVWARKMMDRVGRGDVEANYRYHWLLYQLLEDYFALRGQWYRGPKEALATLRSDDPRAFALFESALSRTAPPEALAPLVAYVSDDSVGA